MNRPLFRLALLFTLLLHSCQSQGQVADPGAALRFQGAVVVLADSAGAAAALSKGDAYTRSFSPFDLQARTGRENSTEADYRSLAAAQCRGWSAAEQAALQASFRHIEKWLGENSISLRLPDTVRVINSDCGEELGADGYTRANNIVLHGGTGVHLVAHELFHVLSRRNPALRDQLYTAIGFARCNPVAYQDVMQGLTITNPDCPVIEHFTELKLPLTAGNAEQKAACLIIYSQRPYTGGDVFGEYLRIGLLELEGDGDDKRPVLRNGRAVVHELDGENMTAAIRALRVNTPYLLHPEEISAEHFVSLIKGEKVAHPDRLADMKRILQGK